jgi:hypothetical protein
LDLSALGKKWGVTYRMCYGAEVRQHGSSTLVSELPGQVCANERERDKDRDGVEMETEADL